MTVRSLLGQLSARGLKVTYRVRKDGGILITSIGGVKYKGAKGNIEARNILGIEISKRRQAQLTKITRERVIKPRKIPVETPEDLERFRKRVMRKWRKADLRGSISKRNLRKIIEDRGFEGAKAYLEEMERHTYGKAYYSAIEGLISRLEQDIINAPEEDETYLQQLIDLINSNKEEFKQEWLFPIFDEVYNYEMGRIKAHDLLMKVTQLLNK